MDKKQIRRRRSSTVKKERLPLSQRAAHGVGHVLNDLVSNVWFSYLIIFLTKVVQLSNRHTGLVILLGQIADGIFTPFIGIICDRTVCRYGRRKVWHLVGTVLVTVTFPLLLIHLLKDDTPDIVNMVYYVGIAAVFQFGWGCVQISHLSLIPEISRRNNERVELNAIRSAVTFLCGMFAYGATWILLGQSSEYSITPRVWKEFMYLSFIIIVSGNITNVIFHVVIKEPLSSAYLERLAEKQSLPQENASVHQGPNPSPTKDNHCFVNQAMDIVTNNQDTDTQTSPTCNGPKTSDAQESICNGGTVHQSWTCASKPDNNSTSSRCNSVTVDLKQNGSVTKETIDGVTNYNCVTGVTDCSNTDDGLSIIDRSPPPTFLQKSRMEWLKCPGLYKTAVVYMCTRLVVNISQSYLPLYLTETLNFEKEAIAYFPLVALISGVLASLLVKTLNKKLGQKITYVIGGTISICACVWFYSQTVGIRNAVYAATVLMGSGASIMLVTSLSMIADLVGDDKKCGAFIYGAISFSDKVSSGVVIAIIQELNPRDHQVETCLQCNEYVRHVQSIAPGIAAVVGVLTVILFYKSVLVCKLQVDQSDVGVQVNMNQPWLDKQDDEDFTKSTDTDTSIGYSSTSDCIAQIHCSYDKNIKQIDTDTRL